MDILLQSVALTYLTLILFVFLRQKKLNKIENFVYKGMIALNYTEIFFDIAYHIAHHYTPQSTLAIILTKLFICTSISWALGFSSYTFVLCSPKNTGEEATPELKKYFIQEFLKVVVLIVICDIIVFCLPLTITIKPKYIMLDGLAQYFMYGVIGLSTLVNAYTVFKYKKDLKEKKYSVVWLFSILLVVGLIIQMFFPFVSVNVTIATMMTILLYFTIENPNLELISDLNIATQQAESANHAKSDFLSSMSHEIRTPLNAIIGFSQALAKEDISGPAKEEVKDILLASNNLLEIVNGILDISKIEADKIEIVKVDYSTKSLINELSALTNTRIGSKPIEFKQEIDDKLPPVLYGDVLRIKQILTNLLTNAVKYTKEGYVLLQVKSEMIDDKVKLTFDVEDSGIGMTEEDQKNLYTKFQRFDIDKNINISGTGLGMAISKGLVDLMNGELKVKSTYGEGTTFTLILEQEISTKPVEEVETKPTIIKIEPFDASGQKVLVVDDNKINLKVAEKLLEEYKLDVELIDSGLECINKIMGGAQYDVIFLDIMMPKMKGQEVLQNLKKISGFNTPVVALTADVISGLEDKYIAEGFDDCMSKPIEEEDLYYLLRKYLTDNSNIYADRNEDISEEPKTIVEEQPVDKIKLLEFLSTFDNKINKLEECIKLNDTYSFGLLITSIIEDAKNLNFNEYANIANEFYQESQNNNLEYLNSNYPKLKMESIRLVDKIKEQIER